MNLQSSRIYWIGHVSTFPPLRCGIASFASDLIDALSFTKQMRYVLHYGSHYNQALPGANVQKIEDLTALARTISTSPCDLVVLQHEFGIWGGAEGANINSFLDNLTKPIMSVLHTTFEPGARSTTQRDIVVRLVRQSRKVVVMTEASREAVQQLCGCPLPNVHVIPHGVPDCPYRPPPPAWGRNAPIRLVTPGFYRPDKGFDQILCAIHELRKTGLNILYTIIGEPQQQFPGQSGYRDHVMALIDELNLRQEVQIDCRYLTIKEQVEAIQSAHAGIFGYQDPSHASSGTVPLVMGMGRPVLCTPFEYARSKAQEGSGIFLSNAYDAVAIAAAIETFLRIPDYGMLSKGIYDRTRKWTWPAVGAIFESLFHSL